MKVCDHARLGASTSFRVLLFDSVTIGEIDIKHHDHLIVYLSYRRLFAIYLCQSSSLLTSITDFRSIVTTKIHLSQDIT